MDAILTAGGAPAPGQPLFEQTQGGYKALLDINGRSMIQWTLDALSGSACIDRVVVVGLPEDSPLTCAHPLTLLPNQGGMLENLCAGVSELRKEDPEIRQVIACSSDIPMISSNMVDWMVHTVQESDHDLYYNVIDRATMERRFPGSHRTYVKLKGIEVCGGDINAVDARAVSADNPLFQRIIAARKSPVKQASLLGLDTLLMLLFRRLDLEQTAQVASARLGIRGRAIHCPYAEMGMDVDKPHQLEIARRDLRGKTNP